MEISPRLEALARLVTPGGVVADVGTDHALLPIYLIREGLATRVIATDVERGPYSRALSRVEAEGLGDRIEVRKGDGLEPLAPGEVQEVVIAGMGGQTIAAILTRAHPSLLATIDAFLLGPMTGAADLRYWLDRNLYAPVAERLVEDSGRIYEIIKVSRDPNHLQGSYLGEIWDGSPPEDLRRVERAFLYEVGPCLWSQGDRLLRRYLEEKLRAVRAVQEEMASGGAAGGLKEEFVRRERLLRYLLERA